MRARLLVDMEWSVNRDGAAGVCVPQDKAARGVGGVLARSSYRCFDGRAPQGCWLSVVLERLGHGSCDFVPEAFRASALSGECGGCETRSVLAIHPVFAGRETRSVRLFELPALDRHEGARVVVGEAGFIQMVVHTPEPYHGEHVVPVRQYGGHFHRIVICLLSRVSPAGLERAGRRAGESPLTPAAPVERHGLVPVPVMHVLDRDERASIHASVVVVAMPLHSDTLAPPPHRARSTRRVSHTRATRLPQRRARARTVRRVAVNGIVGRGMFQVEMGSNTRAVQQGENAKEEERRVHVDGFVRSADGSVVCLKQIVVDPRPSRLIYRDMITGKRARPI